MKNFKYLFMFILIGFISCDISDDDIAELPDVNPPAIDADSNFIIDETEYDLSAGLRSRVQATDQIAYQFIFIGNGLTATNGRLAGNGEILQLVLYNTLSPNNLSGTYEISDSQENLTASLDYALDYDAAATNQVEDDGLISGTVEVTQLSGSQYEIVITDGLTEDGQEVFQLNFLGGVLFLN